MVAPLLHKLVIELTKSRACRSQDNALVEGKNGAVVRKLIGYGHIAGEHAEALQKFYTAHLNPYLNYHRPCGFATVSLDARGKRQRRYKAADYATPYEKLKSLPEAASCLKVGLNFERLDVFATALSDTDSDPRTALESGGLCDSLREVEVAARGRVMPQSGAQLRASGRLRHGNERHRLRQENECGKSQAVAPVQIRITHSPAHFLKPAKGGGNGGPMGRVENQEQVSHTP